MKLVRPLTLAALVVVVLLAAALAGLFVSARYAPERLAGFAGRWLSERIGPVRVGSVHAAFAWGPALEARDVRTLPDAGAPDAALFAARVRVGFDLRRIAQGDFRVARVQVSGLRATLLRDTDGTLHPRALQRLLDPIGARSGPPARDLPAAIDALREAAGALPAITLEDAAVHWLDRAAPAGAALADAGLRGLDGSLHRTPLVGGHSLAASGRLVQAGVDRGRFELDAELPALGAPHAELALADLDLAALRPWLARWQPAHEAELALAGRLGVHLAWRSDGGGQRLEAELLGLDLRGSARLGPERERRELALPTARASGVVALTPRALRAEQVVLALGPLRLDGSLRLPRPFTDGATFDLAADGEPLEIETVRRWLRASGQPIARRAADALTAGRVERWALRCAGVTRAQWQAARADPVGAWPEGCSIELAVTGVGARLGEGQPLGSLRGRLVYARDRLELDEVRGRLGSEPLPALDLEISGLRAVLDSLAGGRLPDPVPPLPGWFTLDAWVQGDRKPGTPSRWQQAEITASRIEHPALLRPIAGLRAVLLPVPFGWDAEITDAWWGSARVEGRARKSGAPPGRIEVTARASAGGSPPLDPADPDAWVRGGFRVELSRLGPFRAREVRGRVRIEGTRGEIREGDAALLPRGRLVGEVDLALDRRDSVPASGRLRIEGGSVPDLLTDLGLDGSAMTGTAHLSGDLSAKLIPRENILRELVGPVSAKLRDGEINQRMNLLLAIAAASDTFNPFRSRKVLPYDEIDGAFAFERGFVRGESISLVGPAARLVGNGRVNVLDAPYPVEAVVGVYFFKSLDAVISRVPLVNRLLLGKDDNLLAAWFALTGPWLDPQARLLPKTLLASGPMGIVTEGVPGFVRSGVETLARLLGSPPAEGPPQAAARRTPPLDVPETRP
ncbi:MAG: AsmA-like C-terminal domain-containing protein [Deltaproteobacteria bacterium]|nr:AsmA-like C-terminal domain-containing protein [Deltaproteobacteria bacterium]